MDISTAIERIKEAFSEQYEEDEIFAMLQEIPETLWKDENTCPQIVQALVDYKIWGWDIPVTDFIPEFFWDNKTNAREAMRIIQSSDRSDIYGSFPSDLWMDRDTVLAAVSSNWTELDGLDETFTADHDIVYAAVENMVQQFEDIQEDNPRASVEPQEFLGSLLGYISESLKSDKAFILSVLESYLVDSNDFMDVCGLLYDWIDPQLWSDKEFVIELLKLNYDAMEWVPEDIASDEEVEQALEEFYG